jgi:NTP pyrophosphatase (non-canonical NTP hydrolase)
MDSTTTIDTLKEKVRQFCEERDWDQYHNAKELAIGIITEAGELLDIFRFKSHDEVDELFRDPVRRGEIGEELADILYFVLRLADRYDLDLTRELERKMHKNEERYPLERSRGSNKKYTEFEP